MKAEGEADASEQRATFSLLVMYASVQSALANLVGKVTSRHNEKIPRETCGAMQTFKKNVLNHICILSR